MLMSANALVDIGGFGGVAVCQSSAAVQPTFAFSSANSNTFVFGGNVQSSMASSAVASGPWNVQVVWHIGI